MLARDYLDKVIDVMRTLRDTQLEAINQAGEMIAQAIVDGHSLFAFGCSHSAVPVEDIYYRAGGLMLVNPIFGPGLTLDIHPPTITSKMEQLSGYAKILLDRLPTAPGDVLILVSVSGRNHVPIEMAMAAKEKGMKVIGITSMQYTSAVTSRHPSGKKMYELVDLVVDNLAVPGDAVLEVEGVPQKICPTSGAVGCALLHAIIAATVEKLLAKGFTPPVYLAANIDGGTEYNRRMMEQYKDRMHFL
ncbi:MAG: SIS domain-containing protein [Chloroflexi bacterium]|nr:SIS domain-containing protein [Chloroflexota bacterium]